MVIQMAPIYLIAMPVMAMLIQKVPGQTIEKHKMTVGQWLIAFLICYGGVYVGNLAGTILTQTIGALKGSAVSNDILNIATSTSLLFNIIVMVLIAPVYEEYLFRKLLIDRMVKYGDGVAVLFSGLFFGLFHGNLNQFAYAFILGLFFGYIYVRTGELKYTIWLHMAVNFIGSVLSILVLRFLDYESLLAASSSGNLADILEYAAGHASSLIVYMAYILLVLGIAIAGIILLIVNAKKIFFLPGKVQLPKGKRFSTTILNVGMALYFIFWIVVIIRQLFE
jgi:membrane protease YdiL (CAAX protease family)